MNPNDWQSRFLNVMADMTDDEAVSITREAIKSHGVHEAKFLGAFLLACREVGQAFRRQNVQYSAGIQRQ